VRKDQRKDSKGGELIECFCLVIRVGSPASKALFIPKAMSSYVFSSWVDKTEAVEATYISVLPDKLTELEPAAVHQDQELAPKGGTEFNISFQPLRIFLTFKALWGAMSFARSRQREVVSIRVSSLSPEQQQDEEQRALLLRQCDPPGLHKELQLPVPSPGIWLSSSI